MSKVLLADDEASIRAVVEEIVTSAGHEFHYAENGRAALAEFARVRPDLVVLDVMMPDINGFDVCEAIRGGGSDVPVMFLSAKGDIVDKSIGFKLGCDDYLVKPFSAAELGFRIEALLRRGPLRSAAPAAAGETTGAVQVGDISIDPACHTVRVRGAAVDLTVKEFEILSFMARRPGQVFTREQLFEGVWGEDAPSDASTITVFIRKIREKIEANPSKPEHLLTVWGVGYKFADA